MKQLDVKITWTAYLIIFSFSWIELNLFKVYIRFYVKLVLIKFLTFSL